MASEHVEEGDQKLIESVMEEFRKMRVCTSKIDDQTAEMENLMKDKHSVISTNNRIASVNNLDILSTTFSKHISDSAKYLEIHKLNPKPRIEMKRRQQEVKDKLKGFFNDVNDSIIKEIDANLGEMIEENKRLFDGALEYHSGQTKRHIQWVTDCFAKKLVTNRAAHHAEIKDTIALDKALMKEQVREIHRKHAIDIDKVKDEFKESIERMRDEKTSAMAMQMQLEAREANFLKMIEEKGEENRRLKIKMEAMRAEERRAQAEKEEMERLRLEEEAAKRLLEEECAKLKETVKRKNLEIKRLEMFVGGGSNQLEEEGSIGSGGSGSKKGKKGKKAKSPKHGKKGVPAPIEPIEATNFSFTGGLGPATNAPETTQFEHSKSKGGEIVSGSGNGSGSRNRVPPPEGEAVPPPTSPLAQSVKQARQSIREAAQEEEKIEKKEEEAIHGIEDEIEKLEARVRKDSMAALNAGDAEAKKQAAQLEKQAREMLEQKKLMLAQKTQLLEQKHHMYMMQQKQAQQELEMLQLQQQQEEAVRAQGEMLRKREKNVVSSSVQTSPTHKQGGLGHSGQVITVREGGGGINNSPASPESGGFSVSSSSLDMDHMEDDYSESTWNDIPIQNVGGGLGGDRGYVGPQITQSAPPTVVSTPTHANLSGGGQFQPELDMEQLEIASRNGLVQSPPASPDLPPGVISQRIRTASGNDLLKDMRITETQEVLAPVEKVEVNRTKTPLRGNIRPKDKGVFGGEGGQQVVSGSPPSTGGSGGSPTNFVPSTPDLGYGTGPGQGTPHNPRTTDGPMVIPQMPGLVAPNTPLRNHLMNLEDQVSYFQSEHLKAKEEHKDVLNQLSLQLKERDLLLNEIVHRLKKSNREKEMLKGKLEKMEFIYESNVKLKGLNVEGFGWAGEDNRPMTSQLSNIDFASNILLGGGGGGGVRPNTAGQYFKGGAPASAIGTNCVINLKKKIKKSKKALGIRNSLKRELMQLS
ncbi:hypothetical protein TrLO_g1212 [Triparma laevis f. longispina]|uniref:Uncharacterized protein n=1 Tax=Triparma laevis f. longispina TaxID=1714387 RepID=A0A9W7FTQ3_9STRA|nr:hypothetical protein TrLO_g1212 [Triparma laevis f. longispina]